MSATDVRLKPTDQLYPNQANYVYAVPSDGGPPADYIVFNPFIHYWIFVNASAARIARALQQPGTLDDLFERLQPLGREHFERDVVPFVKVLLAERFLTRGEPPGSASWVPVQRSLEQPEDYPFDDIIISLGDSCNLACSYCFNAAQRNARLADHSLKRLGRADIARLLREFRAMGGRGVIFTGGEPTLNREFLEICEDAKALDLGVKVITNGTRLGRLDAGRFVEAVDLLGVSLDSADDATNAALWGVHKFRVRKILSDVAALGRRTRVRDGGRLGINIKPTVTRLNIDAIPELMAIALEELAGCDAGFDVTGYEPIGDALTDEQLRIERAELEQSLRDAARALGARIGVSPEAFGSSLAGKLPRPERPLALSCAPSLFVTNTGDIYPCQALEVEEFSLGNAFSSSLRAAFARPRFVELRATMTRDDIEVCKDCELRYVCVEHCHGHALKQTGRTNGFTHEPDLACRTRTIRRLWTETRALPA